MFRRRNIVRTVFEKLEVVCHSMERLRSMQKNLARGVFQKLDANRHPSKARQGICFLRKRWSVFCGLFPKTDHARRMFSGWLPFQVGMLVIFFCLPLAHSNAQSQLIDSFESTGDWQLIASDGVRITTSLEDGYHGKCLRIDFEFQSGAGYCGIRKPFTMELPENYRFTYFIRGEAPINNLEFKLTDAKGENVWWCNRRNYSFPSNWKKETVKKRHITFAWGPIEDRTLKSFSNIEVIIASSSGGKGTVFLDELTFQEVEPPLAKVPKPQLIASSQPWHHHPISAIMDSSSATFWLSATSPQQQQVQLDFGRVCEIGGLIIAWDENDFAVQFSLWASLDGIEWEKAFVVQKGGGRRQYIPLPELEMRYLRLDLQKSSRGGGYGIREIEVMSVDFSATPEAVYRHLARENRRGIFPRYLLDEQIYWTVIGAPDDDQEALINEDGAVEPEKSGFSLEPLLMIDDSLFTWANVQKQQHLQERHLPIPSVRWQIHSCELCITTFASAEAKEPQLWIEYRIHNRLKKPQMVQFYLTIRPFQVNPPWQFLNWPGGISRIHDIALQQQTVCINARKHIYFTPLFDDFSAVAFEQGDIVDLLASGHLPVQSSVYDSLGLASAAMRWEVPLKAGEEKSIYVTLPFHGNPPLYPIDAATWQKERERARQFWEAKVGRVQFRVPQVAQKVIDVLRSNLAYILINRDGAGIQPGSRSYDRSWIRDGSLTSAALLRFGLYEEARAFLEWYAQHLFPNGKVPCVVDRRGPDPVPEHDSNGQFIFAFWQYYRFTGDMDFLEAHFPQIQKAVAYMDSLVALRSSDYYRLGDDSLRCFYGLMPESISHEGYSAKPMHSYWDNFFTLLGYNDAVRIAHALNKKEEAAIFAASRDRFQQNLYRSLQNVFQFKKIDFIPGCVELADFDATSTAIALFPCGQWRHLPQPQARRTFDRYFEYFERRRNGEITWNDFTPYEVRLIGAFIQMGEVQRAHELLAFFLECQRPVGWNHWAEIVWREPRLPRFIGDMPHTWVGSDFINAVRGFFAYEDEEEQRLIVAAGLPDRWLQESSGVAVKGLPTYWGAIDYSAEKRGRKYVFDLSGEITPPKGGILIPHRKPGKPDLLKVNGQRTRNVDEGGILIHTLPCRVEVSYP